MRAVKPRRLLLRPAAAFALVAAASLAAETRASAAYDSPSTSRAQAESSVAFGVVPGLGFGRAYGDFRGTGQSGNGWMLDARLDAIVVLPGDRIALGGNLGYLHAGINGPADLPSYESDFSFGGVTIGGLAMFALHPRIALFAQAGVVRGTLTSGLADTGVNGYRFGGGLSLVVYRNYGADVGLRLGVDRIESGDVGDGSNKVRFQATAPSLTFTFAFLPDLLTI